MKVNNIVSLKLVWAASLMVFVGVFSYFRLLPSLYPPIAPIVAETLDGEYDSQKNEGEYLGQKVISYDVPSRRLAQVLGVNEANKRIEVDLTNQKLYAYENNTLVYEFLVSTGKWGRTPTGTFHIWGKFRYTKMEGGNPLLHTYYYLPNVPYVMFFSNDKVAAARGFSLHGTYWHSNFGHPMSHGCVNMKTEEAETLFYWTQPSVGEGKTVRASVENPGTEIVIYGETPRE